VAHQGRGGQASEQEAVTRAACLNRAGAQAPRAQPLETGGEALQRVHTLCPKNYSSVLRGRVPGPLGKCLAALARDELAPIRDAAARDGVRMRKFSSA